LPALFGQMERTYTMERAAHARAVATAKGRRVGRPVLVDPGKLKWAARLRETGSTIAEIIEKTGSRGRACIAISRRALNRRSRQTEVRWSIETLSRDRASHGPG
jgi:hypothetical protein